MTELTEEVEKQLFRDPEVIPVLLNSHTKEYKVRVLVGDWELIGREDIIECCSYDSEKGEYGYKAISNEELISRYSNSRYRNRKIKVVPAFQEGRLISSMKDIYAKVN